MTWDNSRGSVPRVFVTLHSIPRPLLNLCRVVLHNLRHTGCTEPWTQSELLRKACNWRNWAVQSTCANLCICSTSAANVAVTLTSIKLCMYCTACSSLRSSRNLSCTWIHEHRWLLTFGPTRQRSVLNSFPRYARLQAFLQHKWNCRSVTQLNKKNI